MPLLSPHTPGPTTASWHLAIRREGQKSARNTYTTSQAQRLSAGAEILGQRRENTASCSSLTTLHFNICLPKPVDSG